MSYHPEGCAAHYFMKHFFYHDDNPFLKNNMKRTLLLSFAIIFLLAVEILHVYFIMPFPGSQRSDTIDIAYFINKYIWIFRIAGLALLLPLAVHAYRHARTWKKIVLSVFLLLTGVIFYFFNFKFLADKMFIQPKNLIVVSVAENKVDTNKLVLGVSINGQAKAYPLEIIGYHHQVRDTVGGSPVMITYCTVCRTGRAYSPVIDGKAQEFRLVGMDHFNAMFEDAETKSWWRQATGEAVEGKMKGRTLTALSSEQMKLSAWIRKYPNTLIMQPDPAFAKKYKSLEGFDAGTINSGLEKRDTGSWQFKSWVVGVLAGENAKAYDWNELIQKRCINDIVGDQPIVIVLEKDNATFHVWNRKYAGTVAHFVVDPSDYIFKDDAGHVWNMNGVCTTCPDSSFARLSNVPAYQEFWHSWKQFHPNTQK